MSLSPVTAKKLQEELDPLKGEIRKLADKSTDPAQTWSAEDEQRWVAVNAEYDAKKAQAQRLSRAEDVEKEVRERVNPEPPPGREDFDGRSRRGRREARAERPTEEDRALAFQGWVRMHNQLGPRKRHVLAFRKCGFNPHAPEWSRSLSTDYHAVRGELAKHNPDILRGMSRQNRAQSVNINTTGGALIPQGFVTNLEIALLAYSNVRQWCDVMRTPSGNDMPWPTVNDTSNKGSLLSENTQVTEEKFGFASIVFHAYKYTTGLVLFPTEFLEDNAVNFAATAGNLLGIRLARINADHFTFGTGAGQPTGYITAATAGVTAAKTTSFTADELYELKHSVDPAYWPNAMWTFHASVFGAIKRLKDGMGRYLWQAGLAADAPDRIDGDPIGLNQSMDSAQTAGKIPVAYGDMSKYKVRDVAEIRMRRLMERYADLDQEGYVGFMRCDGNLLDAGTHPLKYLQLAAS